MRQVIAFIIGLLWSLVPLHGLLAILLYLAISTVITHLYVITFQKVDEDELGVFGGNFETFKLEEMYISSLSLTHLQVARGRLQKKVLAPASQHL
jgi:hypothetical protein